MNRPPFPKFTPYQIGALKAVAVGLVAAGITGQAVGYFWPGAFSGLASGLIGCTVGLFLMSFLPQWFAR